MPLAELLIVMDAAELVDEFLEEATVGVAAVAELIAVRERNVEDGNGGFGVVQGRQLAVGWPRQSR
ncbi:hypothetical protein [Streptomyces sp. NPDC006463]|uniref:hypothetical protein n=1 Tax=Streptomyces sp. NPDC006463 TaxID=3364746 RepID=UPI00367F6E70